MFNRQSHTFTSPSRRTTQSNAHSNAHSNAPSSRFSGWALDDDVENTHQQNQEATDAGIPQMPPTPSRPVSQPRQPRQPRSFTEEKKENTNTNTWNSFSSGFLNTYDWGLPPAQPWSVGWDTNLDHYIPPPPAPPPVPPPAQAVPEIQEQSPQEHQTSSPLFTRDYYEGDISTHRYNHPSHGRINYITIEDVFEYITLGRTISDSYFDELTRYIRAEIPTEITRTREESTFHGRVYQREIPLYSWEQYGALARCCLEWALSNPEKLSR